MHKLEFALFALSVIQEKKNPELAKELKSLASVSHNYKPPEKDLDLSDNWIEELHQRSGL